jgi:hypothetical protein
VDAARFWELVGTLGGVADDAGAEALEDRLGVGEGEPFADPVSRHVSALLARCSLPTSHEGDAAEWVAAAVVAAGRHAYERVLDAGGRLDPDDWAWDEAEALLVVGHPELDPAEEPTDPEGWRGTTPDLPISFQWHAAQVAPGVLTRWGNAASEVKVEMGVAHDPAWGRVPALDAQFVECVEDAPWEAALERHVIVSDTVTEPEWLLFPQAGEPEHLVLVVPVGPLLEAEDRRPLYRELVEAFAEALAEVSPD